jgi:O-antigen ligase
VAEASTVNAYLLLWCTPLLYFLPNRSRWTTAIFLLSLFFAVAPAKRGVVTTLIVAYTVTVTFLLAGGRRFGAGRWRIVLSGLALACMIGVFLFQNWGNYEIRLVDRWEQRRDAGRIEARELIWGALTDDLARRDAFALLVGSGFGSAAETVYSIIGIRTHAHNDWLDTAVNMGVLGVGVLFLMHVMIVRGLFRARRGRLPWFPVFLCSYLCLLVPTFISTTVNAAHALYLLMVLGYLMGLTDLNTTAARSDASVRPSGPGDIAGAQPLPFAEWRPAAMASVSAGVSRIPGLRPG